MAVTQVVLHGPSHGQGDPKVTPEQIADEVNVPLNQLDAAIAHILLSISNLPTSNAGLAPGTLWNNGGFVCVA